MEIVENWEKGREEVAEKVGKRVDPVYLAGNPIWIAYRFVREYRRDRENKNLELWRNVSDVVNGMPVRFLQALTIKNEGGEIVTPQNGFLNYFKDKKFTEDKFGRNRFVEYFFANEQILWDNLMTRKTVGIDYVDELGKEFEHIVVKKKKGKVSKVKYGNANLILRMKRISKVLLSGTGKYHIPAGNNSYLRVNKI